VLIRSASTADETDASACAEIYAPYVIDTAISFEVEPPTATQMLERIRDAQAHHAWLVAEVDDVIVGYAYGHSFAPRAAYRFSCESSIYVAGDRRRTGLGSALYIALLDHLADRGYRTVLAGVTMPNAASDRLHRSLGFTEAALYRRVGYKQSAWHDVAWYQRDLGQGDDPPLDPH
jgi:L-amino acid N-acyltransferase YncA